MAIKFFIRTKRDINKRDSYPLWIDYSKGRAFRYRASVGMSVPFSWWAGDCLKQIKLQTKNDAVLYDAISERINAIRDLFTSEVDAIPEHQTKAYCDNMLMSVLNPEAVEEPEADYNIVREYLKHYLNELTKGKHEITSGANKGQAYSFNTIKSWKSSFKLIDAFLMTKNDLTWNDITPNTGKEFKDFLLNKGYSYTTINKHVKEFRTMNNAAVAQGYNNNLQSIKSFINLKVDDEDMAAKVVLSDEEFEALLDMPLKGVEKKCRDLFCIGIATCQRGGDYTALNERATWIRKDYGYLLQIKQEKTDKHVSVPVVDKKVVAIIDEYEANLPAINPSELRTYIKNILRKLSQTVPSLAEEVPTYLTMRERKAEAKGQQAYGIDENGNRTKYRWQCVGTHTARRSGLTSLKKSGLNDAELMSISGHSSVKDLKLYLRLNNNDRDNAADKIADKLMKK